MQSKVKKCNIKFPETRVYAGNLPILASNVKYLKTLLKWVEKDYRHIYEIITNSAIINSYKWKTNGTNCYVYLKKIFVMNLFTESN